MTNKKPQTGTPRPSHDRGQVSRHQEQRNITEGNVRNDADIYTNVAPTRPAPRKPDTSQGGEE